MKIKKSDVWITLPAFIVEILEKQSKERLISVSTLAGKIITEHLNDHEELSDFEKKLVEAKIKEDKTNQIKYLRSKSAERLTFLSNIKTAIMNFNKGKGLNKEELINNMEYNKMIANTNGWITEEKTINDFINQISENKLKYIKYKKVKGGKNEKEILQNRVEINNK